MKGLKHFIGAIFFLAFIFLVGCKKSANGHQPETPIINLVEHTVDVTFDGIHCIKIIDLDGDGDEDIVGGSETTPYTRSRGVAWWRNEGGNPPQWTRLTVDPNFEHVMSVDVTDIDGDTYPDIIATSWSRHEIAWWKNTGTPTSNWARSLITSNFTNAHDAQCMDINGDGYTDVAGIGSGGDVLVWYNDGSDPPNWAVQTLSTSFAGGKSVLIRDIDGDGDFDLLGTAADADRTTWWENQGGNPVAWLSHTIAQRFSGSTGIDVVDLNGDGLYDIIGSSWKINEVSYWICVDLANDQWQKTVVTDQLEVATNVRGFDMDLDGDADIVAVGKIPGELVIYFNDDFSWAKHTIKSNFEGGTALSVIDIDRDGDMDIFAGASGLGELYWWENELNGHQ